MDVSIARFIRRISALSKSIKRIKIDFNLTAESTSAFLQHVRLVLSHYPTEMRHQFKRGISAVSTSYMYYVNVTSMRKYSPAKEKKNETWPFLNGNLNILPDILLHCQPSYSFHWRSIFRKIKVLRRLISSSCQIDLNCLKSQCFFFLPILVKSLKVALNRPKSP